MQKTKAAPLLETLEHPVEKSDWQGDYRDVKVTIGGHGKETEDYNKKTPRLRKTLVFTDIVCLLLTSIPLFVCELGIVEPVRRGFYCHDDSIKYPLLGQETVSDTMLISVGILVTAVSIALGEIYRIRFLHQRSKSFVSNPYVAILYKEVGAFLFGCAAGQSLTNIAKLSIGRLRPHFLAVCQPDFSLLNCSVGYVEDYNCTGSPSAVKEARKSFYSGHASFSMYTMMYLVFYLQARFTWLGARMLRPVVQFILVMLALYTGFTRVSDYRHHPSDVVMGYIQGLLVAYWAAFHISGMFRYKTCKPSSPPPCPESPDSNSHTNC